MTHRPLHQKRPAVFTGFLLVCLFSTLGLGYSLYQRYQINNNSASQETEAEAAPLTLQQQKYRAERVYLINLVDQQDPGVAMQALATSMKNDKDILYSCHALVHEIGRQAYRKYSSMDTALRYENETCGSGYLHGVIEARFAGIADPYQAMQSTCQPSDGRCVHGIGHGLMYYTANDLPRSLRYCDQLPAVGRVSCSEGVFMENFNTDQKIHPSVYLHNDDSFYPCPQQTELYKSSCYFYATSYYLSRHPGQYTQALAWCLGADSRFQATCTEGVGSRAMKYTLDNPSFVEQVCTTGTAGQVGSCLDGMVSYYLVNFASLAAGQQLCTQMQPVHQATCRAALERRRSWFSD